MKHEINTKFEVGDTVYHYYETVTGDNPPSDIVPRIIEDKVKRVEVHFTKDHIEIWYITELMFTLREDKAFFNEDEAFRYFNEVDLPNCQSIFD